MPLLARLWGESRSGWCRTLSSLMIEPKFQRPILGGFVDVYPVAIPDGERLTIPIKLFREFEF